MFPTHKKIKFVVPFNDSEYTINCEFPLVDPKDESLVSTKYMGQLRKKGSSTDIENQLEESVIDSIVSFSAGSETERDLDSATKRKIFYNVFDNKGRQDMISAYLGITLKN